MADKSKFESEVAKGTVFRIFLPLVHFDQEVVAA